MSAHRALGGVMHGIDHGQLLSSIAATLRDCLLALDATGRVTWASPASEELLGWRPDEIPEDALATLLPAVDRLRAGEPVDPFV